ncbi:hypothetical protein [Pararobbsia alpina]|uniref:Uncharacterized protein n=1 Tax=Pararobbsia alpina TaxID=621374 RepID=A0A6S7BA80_9BURK|nr:hypothetical protein [Pararobbsia alpina]CAB3784165.1 hypothetical protein LMG28138_01753 [Pararobbsia alpina]
MIKYFISYTNGPKPGDPAAVTHGVGRCDITTDAPITSCDRVFDIERAIIERHGFAWCVVTNWQRFEE